MKKLNKIIGCSLSIIIILLGFVLIAVGIVHFIALVSGGIYFFTIGLLAVILSILNYYDIKDN